MKKNKKRIAINISGGFIPGINNVIAGAVLAANRHGWEVCGIHDGFDGLLFPERYPSGGVIELDPQTARHLIHGTIIGTASASDPFNVRKINSDGIIEETDRSGELLAELKKHKIDALISVVEGRALSILLKLNRLGLRSVCIPKSIENDIWSTSLSFGFNTALNSAAEMLERIRQAAESTHKIAVVEVPGTRTGWLALQSGMATLADAVLIPEIPYDINYVASELGKKISSGKRFGIVVAAEGAVPVKKEETQREISSFNASLSPHAKEGEGPFVIERSGLAANHAALELQRLTELETYPIVIGQLVRGGTPTAVDKQLGLGYGAGAVKALNEDQSGVMVVFQPPDLKYVSLAESINKVRTVPTDSLFIKITQALGICLGSEVIS
ncbi:MAG: 6-phosphofructokinase [Ignavibacteria bacterium]